ncbi:MAG: carbohydrate binding domain-containing protein, partial [Lachnospiraceae bacterium]|nr:carbohydrate binding domain-containing protein [Lachnospiraceae bacterium]
GLHFTPELLEKAQADLAADCQPKVGYELELESMALERAYGSEVAITNIFQLGDMLHVVDPDINVDKAIRLTGFTRDCYSQPYKYKVTLSDTVEVSLIQNILEDLGEQEQEIIDLTNRTNVELMRMQWRTTQELLGMVFDADGYFDASHIRPSSIETLMLSVGNRNGQFVITDVMLIANALNGTVPNANLFVVQSNGGMLHHYAIEENIRTWQVQSQTYTLTSNGAMYLYAQCPKAGTVCRIIPSTQRMETEVGSNYYFLVGVISSVYNGYRELTTTYGNTRITGRCINCGRIESTDKNTYFDLDKGEIGGNIKFRSTSGDLLSVSELEQQLNDSTDNLSQTLAELQDTINQLQEQVDGAIEYWFGEGKPTLDNEPAVQWVDEATRESHMGDIYTDTATGLEYRYSRRGYASVVNGQLVRHWNYYWQQIPSTGIGAAIQAANNALDLAGTKAHVYVTANASTTPPATYKMGDLWIMLDTYKMKICVANAGTAYKSSDWKDAGYTDDTQANKALQQLTDLASDSIITPAEKITLKDEMANIKVDYSTVRAKATLVGCSTTDFDAAYSTLLAYTNTILASMTTNSTVNKGQYNDNFTAYYTERTNLLDAISSKYTDTAIGSLEIGGTNYIKNSAYMPDTKGWVNSLSATNKQARLGVYADTVMGNVLRLFTYGSTSATGGSIGTFNWWYFGTGMQSSNGNITLPDNKFRNGITYTVAFWVKASAAKTLRVGFMDSTAANVVASLKSFNVSTQWQRITYTFTANDKSSSSTRLYITATEDNIPTYLYFTKFVLVEGNVAPEWQPNNAEQMAAVQANTDLLKAISDNYTQIEGGLILSTFLKLGALQQNGQWQESAGLKAMLNNTSEIAAYFGGTYTEALAGIKDAMTIIYHNGKLKALNAEITGVINALSGKIANWLMSGNIIQSEYEASSGVPAIRLNSETGQILCGESVVLDAEGLSLMSGGTSRLKVMNTSVGEFSEYIIKRSGNFSMYRSGTGSWHAPYSGYSGNPAITWTNNDMTLNLGFMEAGSQINIDSFSISVQVPTNPSKGNKPIIASYNKPMSVDILCDGKVVKSFLQTSGLGTSAQSGSTLQHSGTGGAYYVTKGNAGTYSIRFNLNSCILFRCEGIATVSIQSASISVYGSFSRANYERTILGNDGMLSMWSNG